MENNYRKEYRNERKMKEKKDEIIYLFKYK